MAQAPSPKLQQLQFALQDLSPAEKLWLLEFLIQQLRQILPLSTTPTPQSATASDNLSEYDPELEMMAADPEMQRELAITTQEFACTELDGLETLSARWMQAASQANLRDNSQSQKCKKSRPLFATVLGYKPTPPRANCTESTNITADDHFITLNK